MLKSREFKNLIYTTLLSLIILFIISLSFSLGSIKLYKNYIIENNAKIVSSLTKKYPNMENEIIDTIVNNKEDINNGIKILEKYGIDKDSLYLIKLNDEFKNNLILINIIFIILSLLIITIIFFIHIRKIYKKCDKLNNYINDVLNDNYTLNISEYEEGIFSTLSNDVYKITNKLKEQSEILYKDKKYLETTLEDISHQLKTPLTSMYMINDLLYDDKIDKKTKYEFLNKNKEQLQRIEWLVTSLLKLSKLESGTIKLNQKNIKVKELINKSVESIRIPIELKDQELIMDVDNKTIVNIDLNWTSEAILNIVKNAYEHTPNNGVIKISVKDNPLYVEINITDNGVGIDDEDINHIFERFYKGKHNSKDSIGIGLNMAKQIIERQKGEINVISKKGNGTTFIIKFYKNSI